MSWDRIIVLAAFLPVYGVHGQDSLWRTTVDTVRIIDTRGRDDMTIRYCTVGYSQVPNQERPVILLFSRSLVLSALEAWQDTLGGFLRKHKISMKDISAERRNTKKVIDYLRASIDTISLSFARADLDSIFHLTRDEDHARCFDALQRVGSDLLFKGEVQVLDEKSAPSRIYQFDSVVSQGECVVFSSDFVLPDGLRVWNLEWSSATGGPEQE